MNTRTLIGACIVALACACKSETQSSAEKSDAAKADTTKPDAVNSDAGKAGPQSPSANVATYDGVGRARIGATLAQLREAGPVPDPKPGEKGCRILHLDWMPEGTNVMLTNDTLSRIDMIRQSAVRTIDGAGIGDTEEKIHQLYPRVQTQPDKYVATDHDLIVASSNDTTRLMIFDTDGKTVKSYRVGKQPQVTYVEGCN